MDDARLEEISAWVRTQVSPDRYEHIEGVAATAAKLARRYHLPVLKARTAAWLHDCAKELTRSRMEACLRGSGFEMDPDEKRMPGLWHPHAGAALALKKWGIKDAAILEAIRCHTLGKPGMGPLACLIFVADFTEPGRRFPEVAEARKAAAASLTEGVLAKAALTIGHLTRKKMSIHPRLVGTWNYFLARRYRERS